MVSSESVETRPSGPIVIASGEIARKSRLPPAELRALHKALLVPRIIEEKALVLLRQGRLSKWFSGIGQEAIAVGVTAALRSNDWILPMHRNLGVFTTRSVDMLRLFRQLFGKSGGFTEGRDRTFHFGLPEKSLVGMISHLGAMLPVACGLGLASQIKRTNRVAVTFTGDGATSEGDFHEALNLAAVWKLPVLFVIENNQYGLSTPRSEQYACARLSDRAVGYGMRGETVDGNDILAVYEATADAAARARAGEGPTLLEFETFRMRGHEEASGTAYVPPRLFQEWAQKDPLARFETLLKAEGIMSALDLDTLRDSIKAEVDRIADEALETPEPSSTRSREIRSVYAASPAAAPPALGALGREIRYIDAISEALQIGMRRDSRIILIGQDIAEYGGAFKVTKGFVEEFGRERVRNTPIIESGALGAAMGLALDGLVPMVEMQFGDFISCGFNQIVNNLAKTHYRWGASLPCVIRAPSGGGSGAGPFHSQNVEAWFTHVPGLRVVAPATPEDAKGLLLASLAEPNPVLFLEHKLLYRSLKGVVPDGYFTTPIGKARIARPGHDLTIIAYGVAVHWALDAAEVLAAEGVDVEVIDLRSLLPWDKEMVLGSVRRTAKVLVLHEASLTGGFGAEVAATISQEAFDDLDAPVTRLGGSDTPIPFAEALEEMLSPKPDLLPTLRKLLKY
ncbi:MAG: dehydrogenase E1 component subunit alpha/beta [Vicinamibacteria bacterium]|nr:dehydrogenase E1 component subunit alpha/beta [Vicinamibacteria bacterium]